MEVKERYRVTWIGAHHRTGRLVFEGDDARPRALRYARERGSTALVTDLNTGELIWGDPKTIGGKGRDSSRTDEGGST